MVLDNLAAFRPPAQHHQDLAVLAQTHFQNDLTQEDREIIRSATGTISRSAYVGSLLGIGLGYLLAYRVRALRRNWWGEFRAARQAAAQGQEGTKDWPVKVVFESGKSLDVPDLADKVAPSKAGDFAAYTLLGLGGLFLGGETGLLTGTALATRKVQSDEARARRVSEAYRRFKIDALRKEADALEKGGAVW